MAATRTRAGRMWAARGLALALCVLAPLTVRAAADEAVETLRRAAAAGDAAALYSLGDRYERADGLEFDLAMAAAHMRLAAERGYAPAQYRLGLFYAGGVGVPENLVESYKWLTLAGAADAGGDGSADDETGLLAEALRTVIAARMSEADIGRARDEIAAFAPIEGPAELPLPSAGGGTALPAPTLATIRRFLPPGNCGELTAEKGEDGTFRVTGFLDGSDPAGGLSPAATSYFAGNGVEVRVRELSPGICRVIRQVAADPARVAADLEVTLMDETKRPREVFPDGTFIVVALSALAADRYVAVDYFAHDGNVLHMFPDPGTRGRVRAGQALVVGDPEAGGRSWQTGPPFGKDLLVAFVSERPLYDGARPEVEAIGDYLAFLGRRLASPAPADAVRVRYRVVETVPR